MISLGKAVPVYHDSRQDFFVPQFIVRVDGREQTGAVVHDILQVTYQDNIDEIDSFDLSINNWDAEKGELKYSDDDLFDPGRKVEICMGYRGQGDLTRMIKGRIKSLRLDHPAGGQPTLSVGGLSILDQLRKKQENYVYSKKKGSAKRNTDSAIATQIARRAGVDIVTRPDNQEQDHEFLAQSNEYDLVFLKRRAEILGYELVVVEPRCGGGEPKIYFGPPEKTRTVSYRLEYGKSLVQFGVNLDAASQVDAVTVRRSGASDKKKIEATVKRSQADVPKLNNAKRQGRLDKLFRERTEVISSEPVQNAREAKLHAQRRLSQIAEKFVTGSGSTIGLPDLRSGQFIEITGIGNDFSGRYFVTQTTHTIGNSGYTTSFSCRRE